MVPVVKRLRRWFGHRLLEENRWFDADSLMHNLSRGWLILSDSDEQELV